MYDTILFDLDGTIINSEEGIVNSAMYTLSKFGITNENASSLRRFIGPHLHKSFSMFRGFSEEKAALAVDIYREYYAEKGIFECFVYDGMQELFRKLKRDGKTLIVATSKYELFAKKIIDRLGFSQYFDLVIGSNKDGSRSEKSEIIRDALAIANISDLSSAVMVGDRMHDIIGASKVGISSVGVLYGFGTLFELTESGASRITKNADEIYRIITEQNKKHAPGACFFVLSYKTRHNGLLAFGKTVFLFSKSNALY